ncbi:hypothetical protein FJ988_15580 [Mesorhizobium sp. CU3]|uniref:hypothetical protein n=1 Tax=Mesorhizobium sp. CU2 TaxID=2589985 RepID=UPI00112E8A24|nr:hypothetical protein [Mesorhizobium sp. CU2]TPN82573.1 hypothetical protein FJ988_15580 [Mesorhizobium sp. CU3]
MADRKNKTIAQSVMYFQRVMYLRCERSAKIAEKGFLQRASKGATGEENKRSPQATERKKAVES